MSTPQDPFANPSHDQDRTPPPPPAGSAAPAWGAPPPTGAAQPSGWGSAPGSPGYGAPGDGPRGTSNGTGTAALVLGILGLLTSWLVFGGLLGLVAIVLGVIGLGKVRKHEASNKGSAVAGIVLGVLSILVAGALVALGAAFFNSDQGQQFAECVQEAAGDPVAEAECQREVEESLGG